MPSSVSSHDFIKEKVKALKDTYPSLRSKRDEYVFSALCVKANFYKNPALVLMRVFENSDICNTSSHRRCLIIRIRAIRC